MRHEEWKLILSGHIDGCNTPEQERQLQEHLAQCAECRRTLDEYQRIDAALSRTIKAPPADFAAGVMEQIRNDATPTPKKVSKLPFRVGTAVAAAAAVAVLVLSGPLGLTPDSSTSLSPIEPSMHIIDSAGAERHTFDETQLVVNPSTAQLYASIDCAALAREEQRLVGVLAAKPTAIPELAAAPSLPLNGGTRYTVTPELLRDLAWRNREMLVFAPEGEADAASAYLILLE